MENDEVVDKTADEVEDKSTEKTAESAGNQSERTYSQAEVDEMLKGKFTQEQVNDIVEKRLARVKEKSQTTNESEELARVRGEISSLQLKLVEYERQNALSKYKIDDRYQDYVDYKVLHATNKDKDYATALEEFFKDEENKKYLVGESQQERPVPRPKNSNSMENKNATDNNLRAMFGLAKK